MYYTPKKYLYEVFYVFWFLAAKLLHASLLFFIFCSTMRIISLSRSGLRLGSVSFGFVMADIPSISIG